MPGNQRTNRGSGPGARLFRWRFLAYALVLVLLLVLRFQPSFRSAVTGLFRSQQAPVGAPDPKNSLVLSGLAVAPVLIPRLTNEYRSLYPSLDLRIHGGGSLQALEDLANREADLAVLNRLPTREEQAKIASVLRDSVESFAVALGGIAVLGAEQGGLDSLRVSDIRAWIRGEIPGDQPSGEPPGDWTEGPTHLYVPDPNNGIWAALTSLLGLPEDQPSNLIWLADEREVARAVAADVGSIGLASTLALPPDLESLGAKMLPVRADTSSTAALPGPAEIAGGQYPLFHRLYLSLLPSVSPQGAAFVTFLHSPRGQRLIEREGFLPARQTARIVQIVP